MNRLQYNENAYAALAAYLRGGRLPHALLVDGPEGCGKTSFATFAAAGALCTADPAQRPCGECKDCTKVYKGIHPDVLTYAGEGGARSFHVDLVRSLRQEAFVRPGEGQCKVLLLEHVEDMTPQASNALLKVLEEPPRGVHFILTSTNKSLLLETILSRVAVITLQVPTAEQCAQAVGELRRDLSPEACLQAAQRAGGSIGVALELLADGASFDQRELLELLEGLCLGSELSALSALGVYEKDKQGLVLLLNRLHRTVQDLLASPQVEEPAVQRLTMRITPLQLIKILAIIEETISSAVQNVNRLLLISRLSARVRSVISSQ